MAFKNYYEILGVPNFSNNEVVREGYRKVAAKYNSENNLVNEYREELLKDVNEAIEVLSNVAKKASFDKTLEAMEKSMKTSLRDALNQQQANSPEIEHIIELIHKHFSSDKELREKYENLLAAKSRAPGNHFSSMKVIFVLLAFIANTYFYNPAWFKFLQGTKEEDQRMYEWVTVDSSYIYSKSTEKSKKLYQVPPGFGFNTITETVYFYKVSYTDSTGKVNTGFVSKKDLKKNDAFHF